MAAVKFCKHSDFYGVQKHSYGHSMTMKLGRNKDKGVFYRVNSRPLHVTKQEAVFKVVEVRLFFTQW